MKPGLHRTSAFNLLTLQELEAEAQRLNAEVPRIYLDDRADLVAMFGHGAWADVLADRISDCAWLDEIRSRRRA
jgi:hypothetical protein